MMTNKTKKENAGYTLLEVLFYVIIFAILSIALLDAMITMTGLFMKTMVNSDIISGSTIMENVSRELKQADDFSFASNNLIVNTKDISDNPKSITYTFVAPDLQIKDSVIGNLGNLNTPNIAIIAFDVVTINTIEGKAAKINLTIKSNRDAENKLEDFENTVILRGSY